MKLLDICIAKLSSGTALAPGRNQGLRSHREEVDRSVMPDTLQTSVWALGRTRGEEERLRDGVSRAAPNQSQWPTTHRK